MKIALPWLGYCVTPSDLPEPQPTDRIAVIKT